MGTSPQSGKDTALVESIPDSVLVREQLKRLVAHALFTNSKRYPVLLTYIVEQTLLGNASELKERTIGVEAFRREPSYDVNLDPVVRTTAAEVRRRLIQYYYNPDHAGELVIELPHGSYVPSFREAADHKPAPIASTAVTQSEASSQPPESPTVDRHAAPGSFARRWAPTALALALTSLAAFGVGRLWSPKPSQPPSQPTNLERFWAPIASSSSRVTYCLGEPTEAVDLQARTTFGIDEDGSLNVYDVVTLARSIIPLVPRTREFRVVAASATEFAQLREGPFVLIGAFDNPWTLRITHDLPFGFEYDENHIREVVDRKSSPRRFWALRWEVPNTKLAEDYAIVARVHDLVTGQPVIVLAGILGEGTEAASEVASNPVYLDQVLEKAPKDWDKRNLEAVVETHVIEGHPGPPTIVAVDTW
jgi:hypothetical protein